MVREMKLKFDFFHEKKPLAGRKWERKSQQKNHYSYRDHALIRTVLLFINTLECSSPKARYLWEFVTQNWAHGSLWKLLKSTSTRSTQIYAVFKSANDEFLTSIHPLLNCFHPPLRTTLFWRKSGIFEKVYFQLIKPMLVASFFSTFLSTSLFSPILFLG